MSSQVKQSPLLDSSDFKKTIPPQLAALGVTLDSQLLLLSVKDGIGVYGIYKNLGEGEKNEISWHWNLGWGHNVEMCPWRLEGTHGQHTVPHERD
jgi:hypothetical protein